MSQFIKNSIFTFILFLSAIIAQAQTNMNVTVTTVGSTATIKWNLVPSATLYNVLITDVNTSKVVFDQNLNNPASSTSATLPGGAYIVKVMPFKNTVLITNVIYSSFRFNIIIDEVVFLQIAPENGGLPCPGPLPTFLANSTTIPVISNNGTTSTHRLTLIKNQVSIPLKLEITRLCGYKNICNISVWKEGASFSGNILNSQGVGPIRIDVSFSTPERTNVTITTSNAIQYSLCSISSTRCLDPTVASDNGPIRKVQYNPSTTLDENTQKVEIEASEAEVVKNTTVSPNPFSEYLNINYDNNIMDNNIELSIYNIQGQLVKSSVENKLSVGENNLTIDTQDITQGLYLLKIKDIQNVQKIFKILKM
jgi:Secretion system C-terminal sorting domain